jgi:ABC-2 type transport system ATP-binding protein
MNEIETDHLTKRFRRLRGYRDLLLLTRRQPTDVAVDDISLAVRRGELFGLLGENGAGKTTLIRMLTTTLLPTSGRASVGGYDIVRESQAVRRLIGVASGDERSFYWRLTGRQNLRYFAALNHVPRARSEARIDELLHTLGVAEYADRRFDHYSSGTRHRFGLARALLTEPRILFLDEPTRALDPIAADELRRHVVDHVVGDLGCTVLLATHTLSEAEAMCDRVAIIHRGRIVESGTTAELRSRVPVHTVLELTISGDPEQARSAACTVAGVTRADVLGEPDHAQLTVTIATGRDAVTDVLRAVLAADVRVLSTTTHRPALEDIYRAVHSRAEG